MPCQPCERTLTEVVTLMEMLKQESQLSSKTNAQMLVVLSRLRITGNYLVNKKISEMASDGRDGPDRPGKR